MAKKPPKARTERRRATRALEKLVAAKERLAGLEPGGAPAHPIEVASASAVEPRAEGLRCLRCDGQLRTLDHTAVSTPSGARRCVSLRCKECGAERTLWLAITTPLLS